MSSRGLGLTELLVVLGIVGILLAAGLPVFHHGALKAGRAEGRELLMRVAADQAIYHARERRYSGYASPFSDPPETAMISSGGRYQATVQACAGGSLDHCFTATAEALGRQQSDHCAHLSISSNGVRSASVGTAGKCWR